MDVFDIDVGRDGHVGFLRGLHPALVYEQAVRQEGMQDALDVSKLCPVKGL